MVSLRSVFALAFVGLVHATPVNFKRQAITTLSTTEIDEFAPFTYMASAAYCQPSTTINWTCGANCNAVPGFQPVASGGDGNLIQFWYVGYFPPAQAVIVAHQGTNPENFFADLTDLEIFLEPLDTSLFPGIPSDVEVHSGFASEQARRYSYVEITLALQNVSSVAVVGHSLGAALALLDGVYLDLQLPDNVSVTVIGYGMPRVGNQAFANFVDASQLAVAHVNNQEDPIPVLPPISFGFHHPSGEVHIQDSGAWDVCPGQDNPSPLCIVGDVTNILLGGDLGNHDGPYANITMGC